MTGLGVLFAILFFATLVFKRDAFIYCVAFAAPFNDSAFANVGSASFSPYYASLLVVLAMSALHFRGRLTSAVGLLSVARFAAVALFGYAVLVGLVGPVVFAGHGVVASRLGLDAQVDNLAALEPSVSGLAQLVYLLLNLNLARYVVALRVRAENVLGVMIVIGTAVATSNAVTVLAGAPWPHWFFDNSNTGSYAGPISSAKRLRGQFSEPSHLGAFIASAAAAAASLAWRSDRGSQRFCYAVFGALGVLAVLLTQSSTGIAALLFVIVLAGAAGLLRSIRRDRYNAMVVAIVPLIGALLLTYESSIRDLVVKSFVDKSDTTSYVNRSFADDNAFRVFFDTYGVGVGIGNNRASSLFALIASTLGLVGTIAFIVLMSCALRAAWIACRPVFWGLLTILVAGVVSYPDFSSSAMWLMTALAFGTTSSDDKDSPYDSNSVSQGPTGRWRKEQNAELIT